MQSQRAWKEEEEEDGGIDLSFLSSFFSLELGARWVGCQPWNLTVIGDYWLSSITC
ncbi:unnamed protein product, partial [Vitis vinifera]